MNRSIRQSYSLTGYRKDSPDRDNPVNIIPSGRISMADVPYAVYGMSDAGDNRIMYPEEEHQFRGTTVTEIPLKSNTMAKKTKGYTVPGYKYGGTKLGGMAIIPDTNPYGQGTSYVPVQYQRVQNGMMQMGGGYLDYMNLNPTLSGMQMGGKKKGQQQEVDRRYDIFTNPQRYRPTPGNKIDDYTFMEYEPILASPRMYQGVTAEPIDPTSFGGYGKPYYDTTKQLPQHKQHGGPTTNYAPVNQDNASIRYDNDKRGYQNMQNPGHHWTNDGWKRSTGSTMNGTSFSRYGGPKFQNFMPAPMEYAYMQQGGFTEDPVIKRMGTTTATDIDNTRIQKALNDYNNEPHYQQSEGNYSPRQIQDIINRQIMAHRQQLSNSKQSIPIEEEPFTGMNYDSYKQQYSTGGFAQNSPMIYDETPMQFGGPAEPYQMKTGGIHIKASKVGSLHTHLDVPQGEKIPVSKLAIHEGDSEAIRKKKQFALNAKHWAKKEFGGEVANKLSKFIKMQDGGPWSPATPSPDIVPPTATPTPPTAENPDPNADERNRKYTNNLPPVSPDSPTTDPSTNLDTPANTAGTGYTQQKAMNKYVPAANSLNNALGTGIAAAAYFEDRRNQRNMQGYNRQLGQTAQAFGAQKMNTQGAHGDYNQQGAFRPDQNTPYAPGITYPTAAYGGSYSQMGGHSGYVADIPDTEIRRLRSLGYKIEYV